MSSPPAPRRARVRARTTTFTHPPPILCSVSWSWRRVIPTSVPTAMPPAPSWRCSCAVAWTCCSLMSTAGCSHGTPSANTPGAWPTRLRRACGTRWCRGARDAPFSRSRKDRTIRPLPCSLPNGLLPKATARYPASAPGCATRSPGTCPRASDLRLSGRRPQVLPELAAAHDVLDIGESAALADLACRRQEAGDGGAIQRGGEADAAHPGRRELGHSERLTAHADHEV